MLKVDRSFAWYETNSGEYMTMKKRAWL